MTTIALAVALTLLTALTILQILVALGLPLGRFVWGGAHRVLPRQLRIGSAVSALLYVGIAVVLLARFGALPGRDSAAVIVLTWVACAIFALSIVPNSVSRSRTERWTMTPACITLALATLTLALAA